jgi:23S rRNA pseudouridine2605 synthase
VTERLQKWLAGRGFGSRREIERWIAAGRVTVDGNVATLGAKVTGRERITVDGRPVRAARGSLRAKVILYHKPRGEICTRADPHGRPTVYDQLPRLAAGRWIGVGRLDLQTAGLLLLTNDGTLANALMHPSSGLRREYSVRVRGEVSSEELRRLRRGVELEDGTAKFDELDFAGGEGSNRWYRVTVTEGRNRLVRRLWEALGHRVSRLIRIAYGPIRLPRDLPAGRYRYLDQAEVAALYAAVALEPPEDP